MIEDTTPCSVENTEEDNAKEKKQHKKYDVATAKYNPFSVNNEQKSNLEKSWITKKKYKLMKDSKTELELSLIHI